MHPTSASGLKKRLQSISTFHTVKWLTNASGLFRHLINTFADMRGSPVGRSFSRGRPNIGQQAAFTLARQLLQGSKGNCIPAPRPVLLGNLCRGQATGSLSESAVSFLKSESVWKAKVNIDD